MQKKDKIDKKAVILDGFDLLSKIKSPEKKIIKIVIIILILLGSYTRYMEKRFIK